MKRIVLYIFVLLGMFSFFGCGSKYESSKIEFVKHVARFEELINNLHHGELNAQEMEEFRRFSESLAKDLDDIKEVAFKEKQLEEYEKIWCPKMLKRLDVEKNEFTLYSTSRGQLSSMKTAVMIYSNEHEYKNPDKLDALIEAKVFDKIPVEPFSNSNKVSYVLDGSGGWYYHKIDDSIEGFEIHANLKGSICISPFTKISEIRLDDK